MAPQLCLALFVGLLLLAVPGLLVLRTLKLRPLVLICCTPPVSLALYVACGTVLGSTHILGSIAVLTFSWLFALGLGLVLSRIFKREAQPQKRLTKSDLLRILLYATVGLITMRLVFVQAMQGLDSFVQYDDNATHLGMIASMVDGGNYSILSTSQYPASLPSEQIPWEDASFYPNAWHIIAALSCSIVGTSAPIAENATNLVFTAVVFPLGTLVFLDSLFPKRPSVSVAGAFVCLASAAFPLRMLTVHGPFPNVAAFCLIPSVCTLFLASFSFNNPRRVHPRALVAFVFASSGMAATHPNAIFTCVVLLAPYLILKLIPSWTTSSDLYHKASERLRTLSLQLITLVILIFIWISAQQLPMFFSVVNFVWKVRIDPLSLIASVINGGYLIQLPQYVLAVLVAIGFGRCARERSMRWIAVSYLTVSAIFVLGLSLDFVARRSITGFWYNDPERIAAILAIASIPLSASGLDLVGRFATRIVQRLHPLPTTLLPVVSTACIILLAIPFSLANYYAEKLSPLDGDPGNAFTFAKYQAGGVYSFSDEQLYTADERFFVSKVKELIPEGSLVINLPFDGSVFAYAADELNVYYKSDNPGDETTTSRLIRTELAEVSTDTAVARAVKETGAQYVLLLNPGNLDVRASQADTSLGTYLGNDWKGLLIDDETPGFTCLLAEGDMRLYKISSI